MSTDIVARLRDEHNASEDRARCMCLEAADEIERLRALHQWHSIESAPRDGTLIDLLYPYPRCRTINCYWDDGVMQGWVWRSPVWEEGTLLPENNWEINMLPNTKPTHWMPLPEPPAALQNNPGSSSPPGK